MSEIWITKEALDLIKHFEGCRLTSYVLPNETWATIGWGNAIPMSEHPKTITQKEADELFLRTVQSRVPVVRSLINDKVENSLTPLQKAAILSFNYNTKPQSFKTSTFLKLLNSGDIKGASNQLPRWVRGEGNKVLPGLVRRRKCEKFLMDGGSWEDLVKKHKFFM